MDDETKAKFVELERQIASERESGNSRFSYIKWYVGGITMIFAVLALIFNLNFNTDRTNFGEQIKKGESDLKTFQTDMKEYINSQLGKTAESNIILLGLNRSDLKYQEIPVEIKISQMVGDSKFHLLSKMWIIHRLDFYISSYMHQIL